MTAPLNDTLKKPSTPAMATQWPSATSGMQELLCMQYFDKNK
jgi:hypothetical protein